MSKYIKDGKIYNKIAQLKYNGKIYLNPSEEIILSAGYEKYEEAEKTDEEQLDAAKEEKSDMATRYGLHKDRNSYIAHGYTLYVPEENRNRLRNFITNAYAVDRTTLTFWLDNHPFTYTTAAQDRDLTQYESFIYQVYCVLKQHLANIDALTTIEEVDEYDFTANYPDIINFDIDTRTDAEKLADTIAEKISELTTYSDNLKCFIINDKNVTLSSESQNNLRNIIDSEISLGDTELTEWFDGVSYTYTLEEWDRYLSQYEIYLHNVNNVMEHHKVNIRALTTIDDVNNYDYTTGYPTQLSF